ncbi:hypothetical protein ACNH6B_04970 [Shewanella basaltis]|uniref:hypothetical protein n=1 Tax=Shewanella basaltis TaxID=472183 RepID=UPI003AAA41E6
MYLRTVQTLRNRTKTVSSFVLPRLKKSIEVRELDSRNSRRHFIVVFSDSLKLHDWEDVAVVTEANFIRNKINFVTRPSSQYPELELFEDDIKQRINNIIKSSVFVAV